MRLHGMRWVTLRSIFGFIALLAMATVHGQTNPTVQAANSVNNQILAVSFAPPAPPGSTTVLNTDESSLLRLESLQFVTNPGSFTVDLFAADNLGHQILQYVGDFTAGGFVCPPSSTPPPCTTGNPVPGTAASIPYPNGLSADTVGNLFVVNNTPGTSPAAQVWVLQGTGGGFTLHSIDNSSFAHQQAAVETLIVPTHLGTSAPNLFADPGDLLVVTQNPDTVLRYPRSSNGIGPLGTTAPTVLIPQCPKPHGSSNCIPGGSMIEGITVWPDDNSLLITTFGGSILRFSLAGGSITQLPTVTGLPSGLYKIKRATQVEDSVTTGTARAFVAQSGPGNHGSILKLVPSATIVGGVRLIELHATVTAGVAAPQGIAVTNSGQAAASKCQTFPGCNLLGDDHHDVLTHFVKQSNDPALQGNIVEDVCVVPADPRQPPPPHSPAGLCGDARLEVNQVCPGFNNTGSSLFIPGYLCGGSGSGTGFALVKTLTTHAQDPISHTSEWNGTYVANSSDSTQLLPGPEPTCGAGGTLAFAWAPLANEGTIVEGPYMVDLISGCGTGHSGTGVSSLWAIGLALDTTAAELQLNLPQAPYNVPLWNFAQTKYTNLQQTVNTFASNNNILPPISTDLVNPNYPATSAVPGCVDASLSAFVTGTTDEDPTADFQNAADLLTNADTLDSTNTTCDSIVTNNLASFQESSSPLVLNPSGQIRSRLANLYFTINSEILGNPASADWPPKVSISVNVSPQTVTGAGSATLAYALNGLTTLPCTLTGASDPHFTTLNPSATGATLVSPGPTTGTYIYTLTCTVPSGVLKNNSTTMTASTRLTVQ